MVRIVGIEEIVGIGCRELQAAGEGKSTIRELSKRKELVIVVFIVVHIFIKTKAVNIGKCSNIL